MIEHINQHKVLDVCELLDTVRNDNDLFITKNNQRIFLKSDKNLLSKILQKHLTFGMYENGLQGIVLLYKEKGFRPYLKISAITTKVMNQLIKFIVWNYGHIDLYIKIKKDHIITKIANRFGFVSVGDRGLEVLLYRQKTRKREMERKPNDEE